RLRAGRGGLPAGRRDGRGPAGGGEGRHGPDGRDDAEGGHVEGRAGLHEGRDRLPRRPRPTRGEARRPVRPETGTADWMLTLRPFVVLQVVPRSSRPGDCPVDRRLFLTSAAAGALGRLWPTCASAADDTGKELNRRVAEAVERGLEYLKRTQAADGHWEAPGGNYPTSMTALAGMCFLMEGSSLREGKYSDQIEKAVRWFLTPGRQQANGLIGNSANQFESQRYMYGHGFGLLFLACVYGEEEDAERRRQLESVLTRAVVFSAAAQT